MTELEEPIQEKVDEILDHSEIAYQENDLPSCIVWLKKAWDVLPGDKYVFDESYLIANDIVRLSMEIKDFKTAREWAFIAQKCDPERGDIGEKEFLIGQVAFESGDLKEAYKYFKLADEISKGLCFQGEDSKYVNLLYNKPE